MARPGQAANRRKRALAEMQAGSASTSSRPTTSQSSYDPLPPQYGGADDSVAYDEEQVGQYENEGDEEAESSTGGRRGGRGRNGAAEKTGAQCLPVGSLPDNFDGNPIDGSQFLAMAMQANSELPFVKTVPNPYRQEDVPNKSAKITPNPGGNEAGPSRHPALPKGSWEVLFPIHFQSYRKYVLSTLPESQRLPYPSSYPPLPNPNVRSDWYAFVNGYIPTPSQKGKAKAKPKSISQIVDEEEAMNAGPAEPRKGQIVGSDVDMDLDSEDDEAQKVVVGKTSRKNEKRVGPPREPLISVIQRINGSQAIRVLAHFAHWLSELVNQLPSPVPSTPSPEPEDNHASDLGPISQSNGTSSSPTASNAISSNYFAWIFSLLAILDQQLSSDEISVLRDLSRAAMRVAGYRWVISVVSRSVDEGWALGDAWKDKSAQPNGGETIIGPQIPGLRVDGTLGQSEEASQEGSNAGSAPAISGTEVDDTLAKCWMIVYAVAAGWGQKDLLMELETLFT